MIVQFAFILLPHVHGILFHCFWMAGLSILSSGQFMSVYSCGTFLPGGLSPGCACRTFTITGDSFRPRDIGGLLASTSNLKDRIQMDTRYIKKIKIHKLKFSKRSPLIWQNLANLVAINFLSNVIKSCAGASSRLRMRHLYARNHFRGTFWLMMAVVVEKWSHFLNTSWVCQSSVAWSRLLSWLSNLRDIDVVENSFTNGCMKFCCEGRSADCNDTLWTSLSRVLLGKAGTNYSTASFLLSLKSV